MKTQKILIATLISSLLIPSIALAAEKQLDELILACDFPRTVAAEEKVKICVIGRADENSISRDIKTVDGLEITPKIIIGSGNVSLADDTYQGFDYITFTAPDVETLVTIEITGEFNGVTKQIYTNLYIDSEKKPSTPSESTNEEKKQTQPELPPFPDVSETHPQATPINYLRNEKIIEGYPDGFFRPEQGVNRAELLKIIVEGLNIDVDSNNYKNCFPDVKDEWFAKYVCYAKEQNWVEGYPNDNKPKDEWLFIPDITVNKVEALKIALGAFEISTELGADTTVPFNDTVKNAWYEKYIATSLFRKIIENQSTSFKPDQSMTRGSISDIIYRLAVMKRFNSEVFNQNLLESPENTSEFF